MHHDIFPELYHCFLIREHPGDIIVLMIVYEEEQLLRTLEDPAVGDHNIFSLCRHILYVVCHLLQDLQLLLHFCPAAVYHGELPLIQVEDRLLPQSQYRLRCPHYRIILQLVVRMVHEAYACHEKGEFTVMYVSVSQIQRHGAPGKASRLPVKIFVRILQLRIQYHHPDCSCEAYQKESGHGKLQAGRHEPASLPHQHGLPPPERDRIAPHQGYYDSRQYEDDSYTVCAQSCRAV